MSRPSWGQYFMGIAHAVSQRADCLKPSGKIGAVLVSSDHRIISTGYPGTEPGGPSCLAGECPRAFANVELGSSYDTGPGACISTHAEANAILYAGRSRTQGGILYVTREPCEGCMKLIRAAGIVKVVWPEGAVEYVYDVPVQLHSH